MAGAGTAILFMVSLVGLTIWSFIYLIFASHYFLTTLTDSSAGHNEVQYPREVIFDWWWKPLFCLWVLSAWVIPVTVLLIPVAMFNPIAFAIVWLVIFWIVYPLSLLSTMHTGNWFFFMHPVVVWRALRHWKAFAYVHGITLLPACLCIGFLFAAFTESFLWAIPVAFMVPTLILFCARNWGRFAWLSLNFVPRKKKPRRDANATAVPEMDVEEIDEGLPPDFSTSIQEGMPMSAGGIVAGLPTTSLQAEHEAEETADTKPYLVIEDGLAPPFQEIASTPGAPALGQTPAAPADSEEEDEWATEKKPYGLIGAADFTALPTDTEETKTAADRPINLSRHYDEQHERDKAANRKAREKADSFTLVKPSKKTPMFVDALFFGVWRFMIYERTLGVWGNLVVLTIVELLLLFMTWQFFLRLPLD